MASCGIDFHRVLTRLENSSIDFMAVIPKHHTVLVTASKNHPVITIWDIIRTSTSSSAPSSTVDSTSTTSSSSNNDKTLLVMRGQLTNLSKSCEIKLTDLRVTPNSEYIISSYSDGSIRIWNWKTFECKKVLNGHSDSVLSIDCSLDSSLLVSSSKDNTMRLWNINGGQCLKKINANSKGSHTDTVKYIRFIKNITSFYTHTDTNDSTNTTSNNSNDVNEYNSVEVEELTVQDDYLFVSLGNDGCIKLWQVKNQSQCISLANLNDKYDATKFLLTPDGSFFSLAGSLNNIELIENVTSSQPYEFKHLYDCHLRNNYDETYNDYIYDNGTGEYKQEKKSSLPVTCIDMCYSPNRYWLSYIQSNGILASIDLEGKVIFHYHLITSNKNTKNNWGKPKKNTIVPKSLIWSYDGELLFVGCSDGSIQIFKVTPNPSKYHQISIYDTSPINLSEFNEVPATVEWDTSEEWQ